MVEQPPERFTILLRQPGKGDGVHLVECAALFLYERLCSFGGIQPVAALVVCVSTLFEKPAFCRRFVDSATEAGVMQSILASSCWVQPGWQTIVSIMGR